MVFLISLICAIAFAFVFRIPLKKAPWVFYAVALILVILFVARESLNFPVYVQRPIFYLMQKCTAAEALFVIVMYIGVLGEKSKLRAYLVPIRAELSILACLLALGHIVNYLMSFVPQVAGAAMSLRANILFSIGFAVLLVALLLILGITSFNVVKHRMNASKWRRIQWLAYPFFLLTYVHILLFLLPSALSGAATAQFSTIVYTVVFIAYIALRAVATARKRKRLKNCAQA
ncbi:MAG: ferric reductase-like transmembrane domain-containing protein [Coriobacteriales bacterium]|nr:ferric reductase-like transmembrane domain-containing protein [Coriobacteriales bacterium]